jgi:protein-disulfide isomerase
MKYNLSNKISILVKTIFFLFIFSLKSYSDNLKINNDLVTLGEDKAKVKIKIFSSFTCPHCASFHFNIVPQIKKKYVDTGKVQLIFIDFPLDQAAFNVSKLLHCVEKNKQIIFMDNIYKNQNQWTNGSNIEDINKNIKKIVESMGISSTQFDKCLIDEDISDKILNGRIDASKKYTINSTPTIVINEKKLEGSVSFENIKKKIEKII